MAVCIQTVIVRLCPHTRAPNRPVYHPTLQEPPFQLSTHLPPPPTPPHPPNLPFHTQPQISHQIKSPYEHIPHFDWHQFAAPQKFAPAPQKLLPEQHSPVAHLALTTGPQVSPALAVFGWEVGRGGEVSLSHLP